MWASAGGTESSAAIAPAQTAVTKLCRQYPGGPVGPTASMAPAAAARVSDETVFPPSRLTAWATVEQEGYDLGLTDTARNDLRKRAEAVLPTLKDWTLVEHWAGLRPKSPDGLPLLGPLANGVFVAGGQYRNGILFAPAIADHMRDQVLGRAAVIPAFDPRRFS